MQIIGEQKSHFMFLCIPFNPSIGFLLCVVTQKMQQVHSEGDQPWDFFGRNDAKAETPVLWPPHEKS